MTGKRDEIDRLLAQSQPRSNPITRPRMPLHRSAARSLKEWASSQVSAYRIGLVLGYVAMIYFGTSALVAGIPAFQIAAPEWWTPVWAWTVMLGGLVAGIGAIRAGAEPITREVRIFNWIELFGAIALFLTIGGYAVMLLILGYVYGDEARASVGSGFFALSVHPAVRVFWLILRPRFIALKPRDDPQQIKVPSGHALFKINDEGHPIAIITTAVAAQKTETKV